jgi:hypothetical protein
MKVRPDFVFPKIRLTLFVDGCFWHGCPKHAMQPKGNAAFWRRKLPKTLRVTNSFHEPCVHTVGMFFEFGTTNLRVRTRFVCCDGSSGR